MKSSEKRLRVALRVALQARDCVRGSAEWDRAWGLVEVALYATDRTDLERLVEWLELMFDEEDGDSAAQYGFIKTLDHIAAEFGVGGEDGRGRN